ncbi:MAG: ABC transporter permease subunit [Bryobacteraceae bacterium]|nr:ABC transporter permease subunit [Bryobacteraceae bacterium]
MILNIAVKELTELVRDPWVRRMAIGFQLMLLLALAGAAWNHLRWRGESEAVRAAARQTWINQGNKTPLAATYFGMLGLPPRSGLAILDPGTLPYLGQVTRLRAGAGTRFEYPEMVDQALRPVTGVLTPAFCLQILFPLLMIVVLHTLISRERESGLERFLQALGVNPATVFFGKILAGATAVLALFAVSALLMVVTVGLAGPLTGADLPALALWFCLYGLFYGVVLWLIFAVSALLPSSHGSVGTLLGGWLVLAVFLPSAMADLARSRPVAPTAIEVSRILKSDFEMGVAGEYPARELRSESSLQLLLNQLGAGRREQLPISYPATHLMTEEELLGWSLDQRLGSANAVMANQGKQLREWSAFTPVIAIQTLSQTLCGSDPLQRLVVEREFETARRRFIRILNRDMAANARASTGELERGKALWDSVSLVTVEPPPPLDALEPQTRQIVTLLLWFAGMSVAAFGAVLVLPARRAR